MGNKDETFQFKAISFNNKNLFVVKKTKNSLGEEKSLSAKMGDAYPKYSERNKYSEENE